MSVIRWGGDGVCWTRRKKNVGHTKQEPEKEQLRDWIQGPPVVAKIQHKEIIPDTFGKKPIQI